MKQFDTEIVDQIISEAKPNKFIFLAGENGAGKSRILGLIANKLYSYRNEKILAISNSTYTRFPSRISFRKDNYHRYLSGMRNNKPAIIIKEIFSNDEKLNNSDIIYGLTRTLEYLEIAPEIGFSIDLKNIFKELYDPNYFSSETDYNRSRNNDYHNYLRSELKKVIDDLYFLEESTPEDRQTLIYLEKYIEKSGHIQWINIPYIFENYGLDFIRSLLKIESKLGRNLKINVYCRKKTSSRPFPIDSISSGESSLFCTFQFILSKIKKNEKNWILIDEPENSLHPKWQRDYCKNLLNNFNYHESKIIIATHSPMIVSGASMKTYQNHIDADKVYTPNSSSAYKIRDTEGVEALLMDVFDTLMPKNHNLSSQAQILLDDLSNKKISIIDTINKINEWKSKAVEKNQLNFLEDLENLAYKFS